MASGVFDDALIKHLWSSDEFRDIFSDANRIQKWYDFEAALALEQADLGIIPHAAANEIAAKAKIANVDIETIAAEIRRIKHPLVPALKASLAKAREVLGGMDDAKLMETWRLMSGGKELMALPRAAVIRMIMLNHWYHHRGQLLVYLRMHNVPLPSVYGPTADENPFAAAMAATAH